MKITHLVENNQHQGILEEIEVLDDDIQNVFSDFKNPDYSVLFLTSGSRLTLPLKLENAIDIYADVIRKNKHRWLNVEKPEVLRIIKEEEKRLKKIESGVKPLI